MEEQQQQPSATPVRANLAEMLLRLKEGSATSLFTSGLKPPNPETIEFTPQVMQPLVPVALPKEEPAAEVCNCRKSGCLKLYCQCFAARSLCSANCNCVGCVNNDENCAVRQDAIRSILERNPNAFESKFKSTAIVMVGDDQTAVHKIGCRCRKSMCLKKYCECFQAMVPCSGSCTCLQCCNTIEAHKQGQLPFSNRLLPVVNSSNASSAAAATVTSSSIVLNDPSEFDHQLQQQQQRRQQLQRQSGGSDDVTTATTAELMPPPSATKSFAEHKFYKGSNSNSSSSSSSSSNSDSGNGAGIYSNSMASPPLVYRNSDGAIITSAELQLSAGQVPITTISSNSSNIKLLANEQWLEVAAQDLASLLQPGGGVMTSGVKGALASAASSSSAAASTKKYSPTSHISASIMTTGSPVVSMTNSNNSSSGNGHSTHSVEKLALNRATGSSASAALLMIDPTAASILNNNGNGNGYSNSGSSGSSGISPTIGLLKPRRHKKKSNKNVEFASSASSSATTSAASSVASSPADDSSSITSSSSSSCNTSVDSSSSPGEDYIDGERSTTGCNMSSGSGSGSKPPRVPTSTVSTLDRDASSLVTPHKNDKMKLSLLSAPTPNSSNVIDALSLLINSKSYRGQSDEAAETEADVDTDSSCGRKRSFDTASVYGVGTDEEDCMSNKSRTSSFGSDYTTGSGTKIASSATATATATATAATTVFAVKNRREKWCVSNDNGSHNMEIDTNISPSLVVELPSHTVASGTVGATTTTASDDHHFHLMDRLISSSNEII